MSRDDHTPCDARMRPLLASEATAASELALRSKAVWGYDVAFLDACRPVLTYSAEDFALGEAVGYERGGALCGFYLLLPITPPVAELAGLFVAPECRGKGIGRALIRGALARAKVRGCDTVRVESDPNAAAFYRDMGGAPAGYAASEIQSDRKLPVFTFSLDRPTTAIGKGEAAKGFVRVPEPC